MSLSTNANRADSGWWETIKIVLQALAIALVVRVFFYQPFNIPSGSMKPTLLVGDYLFVSKLSYGYSRFSFPWSPNLFGDGNRLFSATPERGDVVVFKLPRDRETDYIKRVIGLPGDEILVRGGVLYINGEEVKRERKGSFETVSDTGRRITIPQYVETLPNGVSYRVLDAEQDGAFDNVGPYKVPEGKYFMMGDNRDNSTDSRALWGVGYVPHENLIGEAQIIFFSCAVDEPGGCSFLRPWAWPFDIRWSRFFTLVR